MLLTGCAVVVVMAPAPSAERLRRAERRGVSVARASLACLVLGSLAVVLGAYSARAGVRPSGRPGGRCTARAQAAGAPFAALLTHASTRGHPYTSAAVWHACMRLLPLLLCC